MLATDHFPLDFRARYDSMLTELVQSVGLPALIGLEELKQKRIPSKKVAERHPHGPV